MEFFEVESKNILVIQIPFHPYLIILKDKIRQYKKDDFLYRAGEGTVIAGFDTRTAFVEAINKYKQSNPIIPPLVKITNEEPKKENKPLKVMSEIDKFNYKTTSFINKRNSEINFDDLNWELIEEYIKRKEYEIDLSLDKELILSKLKFLKHGAILNGVILNFAKRPDTFISQAHVVIINKKSNTKRFYGSNIKLLEKILKYLDLSLETASFQDESGKRVDDLVVPKKVLREAISNALVHRCYENCNKPITINISQNKKIIEIKSPGGFLGDCEEMLNEVNNDFSDSRDSSMSDYIINLGGAEGIGTGFECFRDYIKKEGENAITFNNNLDFTQIILSFRRDRTSVNSVQSNIELPIRISKEFSNLTTLPPQNPNFIGREADLKTINENLNSDNVLCVVNGIGGVGKSELSYKYLHEHKDEYKKIAFIEMTEESASLEEVFRIKFQDALYLTVEDSFETIIKRLQTLPKKNLLLLDNLLNNDDFKKIKPLNVNFDILVTTRAKLDSNNILNLEILNDVDAEKLFRSIYDTSENIEDILQYLDNHPLFINLTAYSLKEEYIELDELQVNIKSGKVTDIDSKDEKTFKEHLQDTFNKQFQDEENEDLKALLQVLAFFPATEISFEMLSKMLDDKKLKVKFQKLVSRGWLSKKGNSYKLHQIIKTFMLEEDAIVYEDVIYILENIGSYIDPDNRVLIASKLTAYIPIIDSLLVLFKEKKDNYIAGILDSNTYLYWSLGEYNNALKMQEKSLEIREKLYGEKSEKIAKSYALLGIIYDAKGEYKKAEPLYEKALKIHKEVLGENHHDTAISYNNLAELYRSRGEYDKAEPLYEKVLRIHKEVLGENHPDIATSYNNLAGLYQSKGEYYKAELLYEKALKIREEVLGENHPHTATSYNDLAGIYKSKGEYDKAESLYEKALKISEEILGENHPDTALNYDNLAFLYHSKGEYYKAEPLYEKALKVREEVLGKNHPDIAQSYWNLGVLYRNRKLCSKAQGLLEKCIEVVEKLDYFNISLVDIKRELKRVNDNIKKEKKAKHNRKGRYCID